ncbi:MAG TPA: hypothetical protein VHH72_04560 [Solirubrobacterales bacterium]|jgi:hypothetical protein|nr:hypothetical protein [Solirubrobacterales bacterium]
MGRERTIPALLCASLIAVLGGCGGGDGETEKLSAEDIVAEGDEICREGQQQFAEALADSPSNASEARDEAEELLDVENGTLDRLRALSPPDELRASYERYLAARAAAIDKLEQGRDAAADHDAGAYTAALEELNGAAAKRRKLAETVGFEACSAPPAEAASG